MAETIHPKQIESELKRIWDSFQGTNKMRACLFNLIIYSKKCQRTKYLNKVAQNVIEKFPSRIIFITYDEECSGQEIKTAVSVMSADEKNNDIACDMIEIDVCKKDHPLVPFVMLPHILPDLPIYLVYADDPTVENPIAKKLEHFASRIIFDSESAGHLAAYAKAVLTHHEKTAGDVADLNWARTEGWRELFANVFKAPDELATLREAEEITIEYQAKESVSVCHTNIQAIYLQSWLGNRLKWTLEEIKKEGEMLLLRYKTEKGTAQITLKPAKLKDVASGRLLSISIKTAPKITYMMKRNPTCPNHVIIEKATEQVCSLPSHFVLGKDVSGQSLVKEICHKGTSEHYLEMLHQLSKIKSESLGYEG